MNKEIYEFEISKNAEGGILATAGVKNAGDSYRIAGPKAWGGSSTIAKIDISQRDLVEFVRFYAPGAYAEIVACDQPAAAPQVVAKLPKWIDDKKGSDPLVDDLIAYIEQNVAPQVVADERAAQRARVHAKVLAMPDSDMGNLIGPPMKCELPPEGWYCTRIPGHEGPCAALAAAPVQAQEPDNEWRRLALQFDGHRMQAIGHLKYMVKDAEAHKLSAEQFLSAGPLSGEAVLAERIKALSPVQPVAVPGGSHNAALEEATRLRYYNEAAADQLAGCIAKYFGIKIGVGDESDPWDDAVRVIEDAPPFSAPAAQGDAKELTEDEIVQAVRSVGVDTHPSKFGFIDEQIEGMSVTVLRQVIAAIAAKAAS